MFTGSSYFLTNTVRTLYFPRANIHNFFSVVIFINFHVTKIVGVETIWTVINSIQDAVLQLFRRCSLTKRFEFQRGKIEVQGKLCRSLP